MANLQKLIDLDGLSCFLGEIKAKFVRSVNGAKPDSKGNVNIANMEGATSNAAGKAGLVPIPAAGKQDRALCGDATYKVLPISGGGTGATTAEAARNALGITSANGINPAGTVLAFAGKTVPSGYLNCDGAAISRTTYADLFAAIGTLYGAGNASTTFNLPNLTNRFVQGSNTAGVVKNAGLPNIKGEFGKTQTISNDSYGNGAFECVYEEMCGDASAGATKLYHFTFDASRSNSIYGKSDTVQPPAVTMRYIIKY